MSGLASRLASVVKHELSVPTGVPVIIVLRDYHTLKVLPVRMEPVTPTHNDDVRSIGYSLVISVHAPGDEQSIPGLWRLVIRNGEEGGGARAYMRMLTAQLRGMEAGKGSRHIRCVRNSVVQNRAHGVSA